MEPYIKACFTGLVTAVLVFCWAVIGFWSFFRMYSTGMKEGWRGDGPPPLLLICAAAFLPSWVVGGTIFFTELIMGAP